MARKPKKPRPAPVSKPTPARLSRRAALGSIALYGLGGAALLGGGTAFALDFRSRLAEADLTRIGNGRPSVVQIHDAGCPLCRSLQDETRQALKQCQTDAAQYLVAHIGTSEGAAFQARMGLPNVTLVLFDGAGRHVHTIRGVTDAARIKDAISRHLA